MPPVVGRSAEVEERPNGYPSSRSPGEDNGQADGPDAAHTQCVGGDEGYGPIDDPAREFDLFLSRATEDKEFVSASHIGSLSSG
jgi:hypothetical protein